MDKKELYADYLGGGYHNKLRHMLTCDETLLPNRIIDADLNIGGMKQLITPTLGKMNMLGNKISDEKKFNQLSSAALYYLAGILCMAIKSRTSAPPFNTKKYQKPWDKKQAGYMQKANLLMEGLKLMG
ncbi:MAG TPA: hypothetical protein VHP38_06280 [Ruminiclostridium sp.]|nr:hypothetical protein [Ruminiclostridium sp.]